MSTYLFLAAAREFPVLARLSHLHLK